MLGTGLHKCHRSSSQPAQSGRGDNLYHGSVRLRFPHGFLSSWAVLLRDRDLRVLPRLRQAEEQQCPYGKRPLA